MFQAKVCILYIQNNGNKNVYSGPDSNDNIDVNTSKLNLFPNFGHGADTQCWQNNKKSVLYLVENTLFFCFFFLFSLKLKKSLYLQNNWLQPQKITQKLQQINLKIFRNMYNLANIFVRI